MALMRLWRLVAEGVICWVILMHLQTLNQMFVVIARKKMLSELSEFLGGTCTCPEYGGCLKAKKRQWL